MIDVLYVYCFKSVGSYKHKLSRIESLVILYWGINCIFKYILKAILLDFRMCPPLFIVFIWKMCFNIRYTEVMYTIIIPIVMVRVMERVVSSSKYNMYICMRGSRKFCQRGSNTDTVFFSSCDGQRIELPPLKWRFAGVPIMAHH